MIILEYVLLGFLVLCALGISFTRSLLSSVIIYLSFGSIMSVIWLLNQSPDLALTEAAVGVGAAGIFLLLTLKKVGEMDHTEEKTNEEKKESN